jgi:sigma-B regulation protein RsbU (phosphoserine phosphatase)
MTLLVIVGTGLVLALVVILNYTVSRQIVTNDAERAAQELARTVARELEIELKSISEITETMALFLTTTPIDEDTLMLLLRGLVEFQGHVYGSAVAFEPHTFRPDLKAFAPYFHKSPGGARLVQLGTDSYDYFHKAWYEEPKKLGKPVWSKPYLDERGGNLILTTHSHPIFDFNLDGSQGAFKGVATADVPVSWLTKRISSARMGASGYCFLIARDGTFLGSYDPDMILRQTIFSVAQKLQAPQLEELGRRMLREPSGFVHVGTALKGEDSYVAFVRLPATGWSLGLVIPTSELFAEVAQLHTLSTTLAASGICLLLLVSLVVTRTVTKPLRQMASATERVAHGDLDIDLSAIKSKDEIGVLSSAFTQMTVDLKKHIEELQTTTAAKERMEGELSVAAGIQRSMLPSTFPPHRDNGEIDVAAVMEPAKEVGGDFYDFFFTDPRHLYFTVGDVSGKGVPASLFMAVTRFLIRSLAREGLEPGDLLTRLNRELVQDNDSCMFVTVFCGLLDVKTGELRYSNGGHDPGLLLNSSGNAVELGPPNGPVLGLVDDMSYGVNEKVIQEGETVFLFTDGVTEAENSRGDQFSRERILDICKGFQGISVREITDCFLEEVKSFADGAPQADDITMLAVQFKGRAIVK